MAKPVMMFPDLKKTKRDELLAKLSDAPVEHAEALLELYELVQVLHDRGILDLLRGLAGASDDVIGRLAVGLSAPETIRASRNVIELAKVLAKIDPDELQGNIDQGELLLKRQNAASGKPGLWAIIRRMTSSDAVRALALFAEVMNVIGRRVSERSEASRKQRAG